MTVKIEFDGELPFPVEFAAYMVASSAPKDAVKYTPQSPTPEQQAQVLANIGAMKQPDESDVLNFNHSEIKNVSTIKFSHTNLDNAQTGGVFVSANENELDENEAWFSCLQLEASDANSVVISGLHDGILDNDAATVGQVKKVAPYLLVAKETEDGKCVLVVGDWDTMVLELKKGRSIILAGTGILSSDQDVSVSIYHLAVAYQEDGYAVFFHTNEYGHSIVIVRYDGSVEFKYVNLLKLDPTLSLYGDYAAPALVVGKKLGNIETTLATVKPYVVKLVYAYDEGSGEMIPSIADSFGFNWDDMVAAVKSNRPVICYLSGVKGSDDVVDAVAFELTYIEYANEFAIFSSMNEVGVSHITITKDSTTVKYQQWDYVRESDFNDIVGDIETALDSILAIQEGLIGGGA